MITSVMGRDSIAAPAAVDAVRNGHVSVPGTGTCPFRRTVACAAGSAERRGPNGDVSVPGTGTRLSRPRPRQPRPWRVLLRFRKNGCVPATANLGLEGVVAFETEI